MNVSDTLIWKTLEKLTSFKKLTNLENFQVDAHELHSILVKQRKINIHWKPIYISSDRWRCNDHN